MLSGASPDFAPPNPLSGVVLIATVSSSFPGIPGTSGPSWFLLSSCPHGQLHAFALGEASDFRVRPRSSLTPVPDPSTDSNSASCPALQASIHMLRMQTSRCPACPRGGFSSRIWSFSGEPGSGPTAGFSIAKFTTPYRIQQIRSSHWMMSPVVTGISPGRARCADRPFPNRTDCLEKISMK